MARWTLTKDERETLEFAVKHARDGQIVRRAQALLWHAAGESITAVAERLQVSRQTIYNWMKAFRSRQSTPLLERLMDGQRSGRPPLKRRRIEALVRARWERMPQASDDTPAPPRTAVALQRELAKEGFSVSDRTIRNTLRRLNYRFKRPRYVLARRSKTWRQQKGGSNEG